MLSFFFYFFRAAAQNLAFLVAASGMAQLLGVANLSRSSNIFSFSTTMIFSSIVGLGSLLWAGATTASLCRPSHASVSSSASFSSASSSVSSSVSSLALLPSSVSASSVSSSASASSSAAPSQPPCGTNLLPGGANYDPGTSAVVSTSGLVSSSYPSTCDAQLLPDTCIKFEDTTGNFGSFTFSITAPTVGGNLYLFSMTVALDHLTSETVYCSTNNNVILLFSLTIFDFDGSSGMLQSEFTAGVGDSTTVSCTCSVHSENFGLLFGGFSVEKVCI